MGIFFNVSKFCMICSLRTGTLLIGVIDIILTLSTIIYLQIFIDVEIDMENINDLPLELYVLEILTYFSYIMLDILYFTLILFNIIMLVGLLKNKPTLIQIWLIHEVINTIALLTFVLILGIPDIVLKTNPEFGILSIVFTLLWIVFKWYLLSAAHSYYLLLKDDRSYGFNGDNVDQSNNTIWRNQEHRRERY